MPRHESPLPGIVLFDSTSYHQFHRSTSERVAGWRRRASTPVFACCHRHRDSINT